MTNPEPPPKDSSWTADVTEDTPRGEPRGMSAMLEAIQRAADDVTEAFTKELPNQYDFYWWTSATYYFTGRAVGTGGPE